MKSIDKKGIRFNYPISLLALALLCFIILDTGCISSQTSSTSETRIVAKTGGSFDIDLSNPQPVKSSLSQGLLPRYHYNYQPHNLDPTGKGAFTGRKGTIGEPIPNIDQKPGAGKVFDSNASKLIGVELTGFIYLPSPGEYAFKVLVNDAARIFLGGEMIINDPQFGSDRYAGPSDVRISASGFYEFKAQYYQRLATSAFQLFWKPPVGDKFEVVPPEVFFYKP